ncbi:IS1 family transposase [Vibrio parahaemolyticus]|nr:IS1 family transposase [Vibrio parahaemolyticus]
MGKISFQEGSKSKERIPLKEADIQVNTCKNPKCSQFGLEPELRHSIIHDLNDGQPKRDPFYAISGLAADTPGLKCKACNVISPIKSNKGVHQEYKRLSLYLESQKHTCPNHECSNHLLDVNSNPKSYYKFGSTNGSQRFQCKLCRKTFSTGSKRRTQRKSEKNKLIYSLLVNKVPVRRCCEIAGISPSTFYKKVDWLYEQAQGFVQLRERKLLEQISIDRLYLSTDRQVQATNWLSRSDKRNTEILGIGTADNRSDYVLGWHFNFDPSLKPHNIESETLALADYEKAIPFRKYAHLWLSQDYEKAIQESQGRKKPNPQGSLIGEIEDKYLVEQDRVNIESSELLDNTVMLPSSGMLVRSEYTMYAHFKLMSDLLRNVEKVRFYLDQESGIKNAFMHSFQDRVNTGTADAFYVKATKDLTVDQKRMLERQCHHYIKSKFGVIYSQLSFKEKQSIIQQLVIDEIPRIKRIAGSKEDWLTYPMVTRSEPEKMVAALTDISRYSLEHQANLYKLATLHGIDRFFMQARRRVNLLERPFSVGANARRVWYGYNAYNPEMIIKVAELYRLFYNYIHDARGDKKTPAMRLGLAKGKVTYEKIIYFDR